MPRHAFTLIEMLIVCVIIGVAAAIATPTYRSTLDSLAVEGAARDVVNAFALSRLAALAHAGAEVRLDSTGVSIHAAGRTLHDRRIASAHGVRMRASPAVIRYAATGLATGLANGSIVLSRGRAADTVFVSRLGRARR
jgi:prepilin-type N-terminal cleavage/methylation domain-containing protein